MPGVLSSVMETRMTEPAYVFDHHCSLAQTVTIRAGRQQNFELKRRSRIHFRARARAWQFFVTSRMPRIERRNIRKCSRSKILNFRRLAHGLLPSNSKRLAQHSQKHSARSRCAFKIFVHSRSTFKFFPTLARREIDYFLLGHVAQPRRKFSFARGNARADEKSFHFCSRKVLAHPRIELFMRES